MRAVARIVRLPPSSTSAGGAEEALRLLHGVGVETAGEQLAAGRGFGVVGAGQAGDRVEQDDDVLASFDHALGFFEHDVGDVDVLVGRFVERAGDDFAVRAGDGAGHVGHFLRAARRSSSTMR